LAAFVGCCGLLIHSFLDFNLHVPANAALFYVLCAIAAQNTESSRLSPQTGRRGSRENPVEVVGSEV
jgi:hypothetical protein